MMAEIKKLERQQQHWSMIVNFLTWLLGILGAKNQKSLEETFLPQVVQRRMEPMMNDMLKVRLEEEMKMQADTRVLGEDKQARFFFDKLKEVRQKSKKGIWYIGTVVYKSCIKNHTYVCNTKSLKLYITDMATEEGRIVALTFMVLSSLC